MYKGDFSYAGSWLNKPELPKFKGTLGDPKSVHAVSKSLKTNIETLKKNYNEHNVKYYGNSIQL